MDQLGIKVDWILVKPKGVRINFMKYLVGLNFFLPQVITDADFAKYNLFKLGSFKVFSKDFSVQNTKYY